MNFDLIDELSNTPSVEHYAGLDQAQLRMFSCQMGFSLPSDHAELLKWSNGLEAFHGYFRLFGIQSRSSVDSIVWNAPDWWKFAWENRCLAFWCFGETAWGDQYAYSVDQLRSHGTSPVYFLDGFSMNPEPLSGSFREFIGGEFLRNAREPYDRMTLLAQQRLGRLSTDLHLVYIPSVLLGGTEDVNNIQRMNSRAAMICNGDIAVQLDKGPALGSVLRLDPFEDAKHRMRIRIIWR